MDRVIWEGYEIEIPLLKYLRIEGEILALYCMDRETGVMWIMWNKSRPFPSWIERLKIKLLIMIMERNVVSHIRTVTFPENYLNEK